MADDHTFSAPSLIHRRGKLDLVAVVDLGARQTEAVRFTREIVWLRREETTWQASLEGTVLKEGSTYSDYYGPGSSLKEPIEEATAWRAKFPAMSVQVVTTWKLFPALLAGEKAFYNRHIKYRPVPPGWFIANAAWDAWRAQGSPGWWGEHGVKRPEAEERVFTVWRDGDFTVEGRALKAELAAAREKLNKLPIERVDE